MSTTIYYFSATGNSLFIAKEITQKLEETELVAINSLLNQSDISSNSDSVGFIFPVYFFGLPDIVCSFLRKFRLKQGQYCFGIAVHGGEAGNALYQLNKECQAVNIALSYAKDLYIAGAWIVLYKPERSEDFQYTAAMQKTVRQIATIISERRRDLSGIQFRPLLRVVYKTVFPPFKKGVRHFRVKSTCIGCGRCEKVCPVGNIILKNKLPTWQHSCEHCLACLHWCPHASIEFGKMTARKNRYTNPYIHARELFSKPQNHN